MIPPGVPPKTLRYMPLRYAVMGAVLLLIAPLLGFLSWFNYVESRKDMESAYQLLQQQTENNILKAIKLVDAGYRILEKLLDLEMRKGLAKFLQAYADSGGELTRIDLAALKHDLGEHMDLYIINAEGVVERTSYAPDQGLDFKVYPEHYAHLQQMRQGGDFVNGGLKTEARTGKLRKYAYQPTPDQRYLLELGLDGAAFSAALDELNLLTTINQLKSLNPALEGVRLFSRNGRLLGQPDYIAPPEVMAIIDELFRTRHPAREVAQAKGKQRVRYLLAKLSESQDLSDRDRVVELTYSTWLMDYTLERKAGVHFITSAVAITLSLVLTFMLAAWITEPMRKLVASVDRVAQGDLEYPLDKVGVRNELHLLKHSILLMVGYMRNFIRQIQQQNQELKTLDKLKDDFLSNTSHELRTPLNGIIGIADSILSGAAGPLSPKVAENLNTIVLSGRRLSNLINDILDFSKLRNNQLNLRLKPVELRVVVEVVLALSKPLLGHKTLLLENRVAAGLPAVEADENRLQQILHNLVGNAIKFTESGSVSVSAEVAGERLRVCVADTGIGIHNNKLHLIFNSFEQLDSSIERQYGGTGLGLSITRQLVNLHGGDIDIESEPGQGTQVYFELPLSRKKAAPSQELSSILHSVREAESLAQSAPSPSPSAGFSADRAEAGPETLRVLVVDDEQVNLQVLENLLVLENYNVTCAENGEQALLALQESPPFTLILLDIMMPKLSGFEVCRIIRQNRPASELPIIMLTAKNQPEDLVTALEMGANDYLTKPFSRSELSARMHTHIELARTTLAYSHFVPREFLKLLEKQSIVQVRLGDHVQKRMSVVFIDIRSFTALSESMTPKQNFDFINEYLGRLSPIIRQHYGFIDKYIGDGIMALFPRGANDAAQAIVEISQELRHFNLKRGRHGHPALRVGASIHTGNLMLGTIGEQQRMEGTVISDVVNLAARLEGLNKRYGTCAILSEQALAGLSPGQTCCPTRFLGKVRVVGKRLAVKIYELLDAEPDQSVAAAKTRLRSEFNWALEDYYLRRFAEAAETFQHLGQQVPEDRASQLYLERSRYYLEHPPAPDWDGVEELTSK